MYKLYNIINHTITIMSSQSEEWSVLQVCPRRRRRRRRRPRRS